MDNPPPMYWARELLTWLLWRAGITALSRSVMVSRGRFVLMFHGIACRRYEGVPLRVQPSLTTSDLRKILCWLKKRFDFLTPEEFFEGKKRGVLLTFDDGLASNFANALPVLTEFEAPAIFFITTRHVMSPRNWLPAARAAAGSYWGRLENTPEEIATDCYDGMSEHQLRACASNPLITIGSHTVSHPLLTRCKAEALNDELKSSREFLLDATSRSVEFLAYPTGDYNRDIAKAASNCGYRAAFAVEPLKIGVPEFEIPRIGIYSSHPAYLSLKLSGLYRRPIKAEVSYQFEAAQPNLSA